MLRILSLSKRPCFLTGTTSDTVDVKFADGSFSGVISWPELLKVVKRKTLEARDNDKTPKEDSTKSHEAKS